jgi:hypothetical protein
MKQILAAVACSLAIAGCAGLPAQCEPEIKLVELRVPVAVPCSAPIPLEPAWALDNVAAGADVDRLMAAALAEIEQRRGYQKQLAAAVEGCRNPTTTTTNQGGKP